MSSKVFWIAVIVTAVAALEAQAGSGERTSNTVRSAPQSIVEGVNGSIVADGGFELGTPNPFWFEASTNFGTPLCTLDACGDGLGTGPFEGTWWAWFGGINIPETGSVAQAIQGLANDVCELSVMLEIPVSSGNGVDFLAVEIGGVEVFRALESTTGYETYAPVVIDVSDQIDGMSQALEIYGTITGSPDNTNFFVDNVSIDCGLFADGFESGDTSAWDATVPMP
ncbi:MAG: hypothetical protein P8Y44_07860 [Acidobacteriota bacterium]